MAEDRLDDAIDAVVRAVDRIERATRRGGAPGEPVPEPGSDDGEEPDIPLEDLRPPATTVAPGYDAWAPDDEAERPRKKDKHKKKKRHDAVDPAPDEPTTAPPEMIEPPASAPTVTGATAPPHAPAEVHELVGRIVARTQELDDHLEAARALRSEITELVARLAAAATHPR